MAKRKFSEIIQTKYDKAAESVFLPFIDDCT